MSVNPGSEKPLTLKEMGKPTESERAICKYFEEEDEDRNKPDGWIDYIYQIIEG